MIAPRRALELQSWVDGELPPRQARRVEAELEGDAEAQALVAALRRTRDLVRGHAPEHRVPESREFYWSRIARGIELAEREATPHAASERGAWWRWLVPATAVGVVAAGLVVWRMAVESRAAGAFALGDEIETPLEAVQSITFRSESARMTVVWVDWRMN